MDRLFRTLLTCLAILMQADAAAQAESIRVTCPTGSPVLNGDRISCPATTSPSPSLGVTCPSGSPVLIGDRVSCSGTSPALPSLRVTCPTGTPALNGDLVSCPGTASGASSATALPPAQASRPAQTPAPAALAPPAPTPPPAVGQNFCNDRVDQIVDVKWPATGMAPTNQRTKEFTRGRVAAFRISAPVSLGSGQLAGKINLSESPGGGPFATYREFTISRNACDFKSGNYLYSGIESPATFLNGTYFVSNPAYKNAGALFSIQPGEVLYVNVRHYGACNRSDGCNIDLDLFVPK